MNVTKKFIQVAAETTAQMKPVDATLRERHVQKYIANAVKS